MPMRCRTRGFLFFSKQPYYDPHGYRRIEPFRRPFAASVLHPGEEKYLRIYRASRIVYTHTRKATHSHNTRYSGVFHTKQPFSRDERHAFRPSTRISVPTRLFPVPCAVLSFGVSIHSAQKITFAVRLQTRTYFIFVRQPTSQRLFRKYKKKTL